MSLQADSPDFNRIIDKAIAGGCTQFDTADLYENGANEAALGRALKGRRESVQLFSKVGNRMRADQSGWEWCADPHYIRQQIELSLQRLQTDYLDMYFLHGGTLEDPMQEVVACFEKLKQEGKIKAYGLSSIRPNVIERYTALGNFELVMTQLSLLDQRPLEQTLPLLQARKIPVIARGVLASGRLVNKPASAYLSHTEEQMQAIFTELQQQFPTASARYAYALDWVLQQPAVASCVLGIRTEEQLQMALNYSPSLTEQPNLRVITPACYEQHRL